MAALALAACSPDGDTVTTPAPSPTAAPASTTVVATTSTAPPATAPDGIAYVVPFQYRDDVAQSRLQLRVVNHSDRPVRVERIHLVWDGFDTPESTATATVVPGALIDLPVPFEGADCGDDPLGQPPSFDGAVAELTGADGTPIELPVYDEDGVAAGLWRRDCERQWILDQADVRWTDLHVEDREGDPVTVASLTVARGAATGPVEVIGVDGTVIFLVEPVAGGWPAEVGDEVSVPVRFTPARCDAHAFAETKQPVSFTVRLRIDGVDRAVVVQPTAAERDAMLDTARAACGIP